MNGMELIAGILGFEIDFVQGKKGGIFPKEEEEICRGSCADG